MFRIFLDRSFLIINRELLTIVGHAHAFTVRGPAWLGTAGILCGSIANLRLVDLQVVVNRALPNNAVVRASETIEETVHLGTPGRDDRLRQGQESRPFVGRGVERFDHIHRCSIGASADNQPSRNGCHTASAERAALSRHGLIQSFPNGIPPITFNLPIGPVSAQGDAAIYISASNNTVEHVLIEATCPRSLLFSGSGPLSPDLIGPGARSLSLGFLDLLQHLF
jgi:hypothetical protein